MERHKSQKILHKMGGSIRQISKETSPLPPWLFQHHALADALENAKTVNQKSLTNTLNFIHFMGRSVLVLLKHPNYEESILVRAYPEPCLGEELTCHWSDENFAGLRPEEYTFQHLIIADGYAMTLVPAVPKEIRNELFIVQLPSTSYSVGHRQAKRHVCRGITAELIQNGFVAKGELLDFSPIGLRIRVSPETPCSFRWFKVHEPATMHLRNEMQILLSEECQCIRELGTEEEKEIVLSPSEESIRRFKKKKIRNPRQQLSPQPSLVFDHPLLKRKVQYEISDISTSGFSVYEAADEGVLITGMIIPELSIEFADGLRLSCIAQVIYRRDEKEKGIRCGLGILDMDVIAYTCMAGILSRAQDAHVHISDEVSMDSLWEFLFKSDFFYPRKYYLMKSYREKFKETYQRLYKECPEIARHVTYQKNGRIYGHMSMVRAYEKTWLIHHHAAKEIDNKRVGFVVLRQLMKFLNDMHRLPSAKMDYVMAYFRPQGKFPDRVFAGFTRSLGYPKGCSLDLFSYVSYPTLSLGTRLPDGWKLQECSTIEFWEMSQFYEFHSGGLLFDVMRLDRQAKDESLENIYARLGFLRKWKAYSLTHDGKLNALLIINQSDLGLNLSELLNGVKILVNDPNALPWHTLSIAIGQLTSHYDRAEVPILIYPMEYVQANGIPCEKQYQLWVLDVRYGDKYMEFMQKKFRVNLIDN